MDKVFILKTDANSTIFKEKIGEFLSSYCKESNTNAAIFELNDSGKKVAAKILAAK